MNYAIPPTVNLHSLIPCNYRCEFCYAGFASAGRSQIPQDELHEILRQIAAAPPMASATRRKVTFAGGEPLLSPTLAEDLRHAREQGLITSVVTNGSLLSREWVARNAGILDWLTISIDSTQVVANLRIGRAFRGIALSAEDYLERIHHAREMGLRLKLNTVVNAANVAEDFTAFIREARPLRWKLFQATRIEGENSDTCHKWGISEDAFVAFVARHEVLREEGIVLVPETQTEIYGSYAMIGPNGCFFDNSQGIYRYSRPIVAVGIMAAWGDIAFSEQRFRDRNGDYDFETGLNRVREGVL